MQPFFRNMLKNTNPPASPVLLSKKITNPPVSTVLLSKKNTNPPVSPVLLSKAYTIDKASEDRYAYRVILNLSLLFYCLKHAREGYFKTADKARRLCQNELDTASFILSGWDGLHHAAHTTHAACGHCGCGVIFFLVGDDTFGGEEHAGD